MIKENRELILRKHIKKLVLGAYGKHMEGGERVSRQVRNKRKMNQSDSRNRHKPKEKVQKIQKAANQTYD